jgi:hypothetical protein
MKKDLKTELTKFCDRFQLSQKNRKNAFKLMRTNPAMAEELVWLFQRKSANSTAKLNCVFSAPPSLQPLVTLMLNYWKTEKIRRSIENRWPKPVTFVLPNKVICTVLQERYSHYYRFEFNVKDQKITLVRESELKQTLEMLVNNAAVLTAKAWYWTYEGRSYSIGSREGKIFASMIEHNTTLGVAAVLTDKTNSRNQ